MIDLILGSIGSVVVSDGNMYEHRREIAGRPQQAEAEVG